MRRFTASMFAPAAARSIVGVAPVLNLKAPEATADVATQIERNTNIALDMIKKFKGDIPKPYARRYKTTFEQVEKEVESLLGSAKPKKTSDDQPMERIAVIEKCLRQGVWNFLKEAGRTDFAEMEKWIVYTSTDESRLAQMKRNHDLKVKVEALRKKKTEAGESLAPQPKVDWAEEYSKTADRELVAEKRYRYGVMSANTTARNESAIEKLLQQYRQPAQDRRLDQLIDMVNKFKPLIAREAIQQRLTIKHLEGQLGVWRYLDWNPEIRDRAETEADNMCWWWWYEYEEKRMGGVRLRTRNEVVELMEREQMKRLSSKKGGSSAASSAGGTAAQVNDARARLLAEVIALQSRKTTVEKAE